MRYLFSIILAISLFFSVPAMAADTEVLAVIVPLGQAAKLVEADDLPLIFLRKKLYWTNGKKIHPVNLSSDNPLRRQFSQVVLGGLPETQTEYWNGLYYHGTSPPHVVNSQEAMLRFVAETSGAIGYISACKVDDRVRVVFWLGVDGGLTSSQPAMNCGQ